MPRFDAKTSPAPPETPHRARRPVRQPAGRRLPDNDCRTLARQMPRKENLATSVTSISRRRLTLVGLSGHLELSRLLLIGLPELPSEQALELILRFRGYLAIDPVELLPVASAARARPQTRHTGPLLPPHFQRLRIEASENGAQRDPHAGDERALGRRREGG